jgi:hypothetical protein
MKSEKGGSLQSQENPEPIIRGLIRHTLAWYSHELQAGLFQSSFIENVATKEFLHLHLKRKQRVLAFFEVEDPLKNAKRSSNFCAILDKCEYKDGRHTWST